MPHVSRAGGHTHLLESLVVDETRRVLGDIELALLQLLSELPVGEGQVPSGRSERNVKCLIGLKMLEQGKGRTL